MKISEPGSVRTSQAEFAEYASAMVRAGTSDSVDGILWFVASSMCSDEYGRLALRAGEIEAFVAQNAAQISACIAGFHA